ncbi:MAG TPA: methyl-accepting chemotaxis protein [Gemmatimonadales bacterium]|nr:methyl-accepting chemotaxis protein [Gemmatimonadales bacterium]
MATRAPHLSRTFLLSGVAVAAVLTILLGSVVGGSTRRTLEAVANRHAVETARTAAALTDGYLHELRHQAELLATLPPIIAAARDATQQVTARGLDRLPMPEVERRYAGPRQLGGDPELQAFLRGFPERSELVEIFFTEAHGLVVLGSDRPSDLVQQDEEWWQAAMRDGSYESDVQYDSSAGAPAMEFDIAIRPNPVARPVGVLKAAFGLDTLRGLLAVAPLANNAVLQLVDDQGRLLASPTLERLPERQRPAASDSTGVAVVRGGGARGDEIVVSVPVNEGRWRALYRQPVASAYETAWRTQRRIWFGAVGFLVLSLGVLLLLGRWLDQRVTEPVRAAAAVTGRVASGDLTVDLEAGAGQSSEARSLLASVHTMVAALRRLVGAIRSASDESAAMAAEISAATQQMSASTEEMTSTTQDLTKRAAEQAQLVRAAADDAGRILQIATALAAGAEDSVRRNAELAGLARHHREQLDQSITQLTRLAEEIERGADDAEALATSSAQIQKFVGQAKAVATQTNMLALNAAIEAARAGPQGRGFAVVADEVRKLASLAAAAATETADTVRGVLTRAQETRDRLQRLAQTGAVVRETAQTASQGLALVAGEAEANDAWSQEIATSAVEVRHLVDEIAARLAAVAMGTDGLLASAQEIAASSEQQSASTEEIASSANQLAEAADRLQGAVKTFRIVAEQPAAAPAPPPDDQPLPGPTLAPEVAT